MPKSPVRVLMIEDTPGDAAFIRLCLSRSSSVRYEIEACTRAADGLDRLARASFDVALLDLGLPDSEGTATLKKIGALAPGLPVILMTGQTDDSLPESGLREGAQDFLQKNRIDADVLERAIRYAIGRKRAEEEVREANERYHLALEGANDGIWDWDLRTGRMYFSGRWRDMIGCETDRVEHQPEEWFGRIHPEDRERVMAEIEAHKRDGSGPFEVEQRILSGDGSYRWFLSRGAAVRDPSGAVYRMAGSHTDVTGRKEVELRLRHAVLHDSLTGLPNRTLLFDRMDHALAQVRREGSHRFAILFIDLDRFKIVNDSLGHTVGDRLLVGVARRLQALLRPSDTIARLGGDEFVILLSMIDEPADAVRVAQRVHKTLEEPFNLDGYEVIVTSSIGIAMNSKTHETPESMMRDADTAMYRAKALGKVRHVIFDEGMHEDVMAMLRLESELRRAVERQEFVVHYQPIVSAHTGRLEGFEALLRWNHPERGLIYPQKFIPLLEETGLIVQMGKWVFAESCRKLRQWRGMFPQLNPVWVSVNFSNQQLARPELADEIESIMREMQVDPRSIKLEITEGSILHPERHVLETLGRLKAIGVQIQIDDFGTGYCSLSYLHRFPVNTLKIDRSFIMNIIENREHLEIVRSIIALAANLRLEVTAEGVETADQLELLRSLNIQHAQGFLFSQAVGGEAADQMVMDRMAA